MSHDLEPWPVRDDRGAAGLLYPAEGTGRRCPECGGECEASTWEPDGGGRDREQVTCLNCHHSWWVDGKELWLDGRVIRA